VQELDPLLGVEALDAREETAVEVLSPWCREGQTIVLVGSSGSGKSTLTNTLMGRWVRETGEIKDTDGKGRHTTTRRSMFQLPGGALVLDTPGMRELQLTACETGVATTFSDIEAIAASCKFNDCKHETEPGCAVKAALEEGALTERRLQSYLKLMLEQERNAASLAQRHAANRRQTRDYLRSQAYSRQRKGSE
jgi:ribosome biogenesis GTPase